MLVFTKRDTLIIIIRSWWRGMQQKITSSRRSMLANTQGWLVSLCGDYSATSNLALVACISGWVSLVPTRPLGAL